MDTNTHRQEMVNKEASRETSVEDGLLSSLGELCDALKDGAKIEERFTMRTVDLQLEPHDYTPEDVKSLREKIGASQTIFARLLGVKPRTVQSWEQGLTPSRMACRLMDVMTEDPERWRKILRDAQTEHVSSQ